MFITDRIGGIMKIHYRLQQCNNNTCYISAIGIPLAYAQPTGYQPFSPSALLQSSCQKSIYNISYCSFITLTNCHSYNTCYHAFLSICHWFMWLNYHNLTIWQIFAKANICNPLNLLRLFFPRRWHCPCSILVVPDGTPDGPGVRNRKESLIEIYEIRYMRWTVHVVSREL